MNPTETCNHKFCGQPVLKGYGRMKYVEGSGMVPFCTGCSFASPNYDVSQGTGSPFTTITVAAI